MELTSGQPREADRETSEDSTREVLGRKAVGGRVKMSVQRPDGSMFEYVLPTQPLGVVFTTEGPVDLRYVDENH